ncbi:TonB-dependent receptor [Pseudoduganella umbonata]|uniref:Iron complex outermembrane receptor protein n=1 Tax=Pseudoduganella umbonata TaxID=864828 RepID=A0A4P8HM07_9BURK|nr:TonB-dependent receptor [Pseudoduganella umbonata]MBB3225135.1 iron complex outermembrane receptor protein [Pseudoduganella umbonata]QCP09328.1 TonB-dependent receptor [Pseudoduganella umbonata]
MLSPLPPRRRARLGVLVSASLPILAAHGAWAQSAPDPEPSTVVVSATRSNLTADDAPQTVLVIGKEDIARQLAISGNSSDVLASLLPSFAPSRGKMTGSAETLRGRTPLILVDGVPQSNPLRPTGREAHTIDYALVERIEVIQGANAVNGLGATGGTINIVTRRPGRGSLSQSIDVQTTLPTSGIGSSIGNDTANFKASYRLEGRGDAFDYLFALSAEDQGLHLDGQGRPLGTDNTQGDLMDSRAFDALAKLGYDIDADQRLQLSVNRYRLKSKAGYLAVAGDRARGIPTLSVPGEPPGTPPWNDVWTTALTYRHASLAGMELSAMVFNQEFEGLFGADNSATFQDPLIAPNGTLYDQSRIVASKYGSKVGLTKDGLLDGRLKLTGGFDTLYDEGEQDLYGTGRTYVPPSEFRNLSLFLQGEAQVTGALALHAGVRRERSDVRIDSYTTLASFRRVAVEGGKLDFNETLKNAGLVFKPLRQVSLFSSYSEGFGMPDIGRVLRSINTPGVSVARMRDLQPILTRSAEAGVRVREGAWDLDASWFRSRSDLGARVATVNGAFVMAREKTRIDGFDAAAAYRFDKAHRARIAYARTNGRYDSNADGTLDARLDGLNVAPDRVIASWTADWNGRLSSFVQAQHAFGDTFDDPAMKFKGYTLVDASANWKLPAGELRFAVANVFDRMYITYFSQSGLVEPKRYFAGRGRAVSLGYALRF